MEHAPEQVFLLEQLMETFDEGTSPPSPKTQVPPALQVQLVSVQLHAPEQGMGWVAELQPAAPSTTRATPRANAKTKRMDAPRRTLSTRRPRAGYCRSRHWKMTLHVQPVPPLQTLDVSSTQVRPLQQVEVLVQA